MISKYQPLIDRVLSHTDNVVSCTESADILVKELLNDFQVPEYWKDENKWDLTTPSQLLEDVKILSKVLTSESTGWWKDWPNNVPAEFLTENIFPITVLKFLLFNKTPIDSDHLSSFTEFHKRYHLMIYNACEFKLNQ